MPEAFACTLVILVCVGIFIAAKLQANSPANRNPKAEAETLAREIIWLEERRALAEAEKWHDDMIDLIEERLAETKRKHAQLLAQS